MEIGFWKIFKFAKYLIIPILFFLYINYGVAILSAGPSFFGIEQGMGAGGGGIQVIGLGLATSVSVSRLYFGMFRLPVYAGDLGDISGIHDTFFAILGIITIIFVAWDLFFVFRGKTSYTYGSKYQWRR